jgi:tRNA threonylcarbamoyl adenosine modification protein YeaZ
MILVIDTSASIAVIATINGRKTETFMPSRSPELRKTLRRLARLLDITKVAVATGPGSFTGLRVGVSFGLGLAMGRRVPIVPLPTLELQAARSDEPVTAVVDAGRGRYYYRLPGGEAAHGAPAEIPRDFPLVGRLENVAPLAEAGHRFLDERALHPFVDAAAHLLETAPEVPYRNLEIEYMQSFSARKV